MHIIIVSGKIIFLWLYMLQKRFITCKTSYNSSLEDYIKKNYEGKSKSSCPQSGAILSHFSFDWKFSSLAGTISVNTLLLYFLRFCFPVEVSVLGQYQLSGELNCVSCNVCKPAAPVRHTFHLHMCCKIICVAKRFILYKTSGTLLFCPKI